jgi:amidase
MVESKKRKLQRSWQEIAKEAQDRRDASLGKVNPGLPEAFERIQFSEELPKISMNIPGKVLHPTDYRITEMLPEDLITSLASRDLTAVDVTTAFLRRAKIAQKLVSILLCPERMSKSLRQIASPSSCPSERSLELQNLMPISANTRNLWDHSTACPYL